jgi:Mn2+/Fe2+ NRAMP family transporter
MSGRLAAISHHPLPAAVRERFGFTYYVVPLVAESIVDLLVLAAEIGGACIALQLMTGIPFPYWALPVALLAWILLWVGNFEMIEYGISTLGLLTVVFIVAAIKLGPDWSDAAGGLLPRPPAHEKPQYWFLAVSILGATISPYLFNFYSSGAVEDEWDESDLWPNRITAMLGMGFGGTISMAVLICAAIVFYPRGIRVEQYEQVALMITHPLGTWGYWIFAAALFIACFGAALELSLDTAYVYAQAFGWKWGENTKPNDATRFSTTFTAFLFLASLIIVAGMDPLRVTMFSMAFTTLILPLVVLPFLVLMNDTHYVGKHKNGPIGNAVVFIVVILAFIMAAAAIPLQIFGGA